MSNQIHPTAIISSKSQLGSNNFIGAYSVIEEGVKLGNGNIIKNHVTISNTTTLGNNNTIHPYVRLGGEPQDLKYGGEPTKLIIGSGNSFREGFTANIGTEGGGGETIIGNDNMFMAYAHVAHDCTIANQTVLANQVSLAGHVSIGDKVILGGLAGVHQHCHIGQDAFIAGGSMVARDVPPYCIAQGDRAKLMGINLVGLKRRGWSRDALQLIRDTFNEVFRSHATRLNAIEYIEEKNGHSPEAKLFIDFIKKSNRGICQANIRISDSDI